MEERIQEEGCSEEAKLEKDLLCQWHNTLAQEETHWKQKSRLSWLREGDRNTKKFHVSTLRHRSHNALKEIVCPNGSTTKDPLRIREEGVAFFTSLLGEVFVSQPQASAKLLEAIPNLLTPTFNSFLTSPFSSKEIKSAFFGMEGAKAPGPDGFPRCFFQSFWHILGPEVEATVKDFQVSKSIPKAVNSTFIALIPKMAGANSFHKFQPISLCNFIYKIVSKVLANKLKKSLSSIINLNQGGFVEGRQILDGIVTTHEVAHSMSKSGRSGILLKLDISKAYNRVSWAFLVEVLRKFGFQEEWITLVDRCISSATFSVLINGASTGYFESKRGLRQGDLLSAYLFLILVEALGRSLAKATLGGKIAGVKPAAFMDPVSFQQFVDDTLIMSEASVPQAKAIKKILDRFELAAGQKVNFQKTNLYFFNSGRVLQQSIASVFNCTIASLLATYLGMPLFKGGIKASLWDPILERFSRKLGGWKGALLNQASKVQLVQSVLQNLPVYFMSVFKMSVSVSKSLEKIQRDFLWSGASEKKRMALVAWNRVCSPRLQGGLGIKSLKLMNQALMGKLA